MECGQCGKPAIMMIGDVPACIDCEHRYQQSRYMSFVQHAVMANHADAEMARAIGMPYMANPIEIPPAPVPPIHYNNQSVSISNSVVGALNLGIAQDIEVQIKSMVEGGEAALADALAAVTNAVVNAESADVAVQNEMLDQLAVLTQEANVKPEARKLGTVKAIFSAIKGGADAINGVAGAWAVAEPLLKGHFGL